mgnify:CR=1 FL=1
MTHDERLRVALRFTFAFGRGHLSTFLSALSMLGLVLATTSMLVTALNFHQISILGEQGLTLTEAAAMFLPQTVGTLAAGLVFGTLADRLPARLLLAATMALLALAPTRCARSATPVRIASSVR